MMKRLARAYGLVTNEEEIDIVDDSRTGDLSSVLATGVRIRQYSPRVRRNGLSGGYFMNDRLRKRCSSGVYPCIKKEDDLTTFLSIL